jgi:hypothetical protein
MRLVSPPEGLNDALSPRRRYPRRRSNGGLFRCHQYGQPDRDGARSAGHRDADSDANTFRYGYPDRDAHADEGEDAPP